MSDLAIINKSTLVDIADAIREKTGTADTMSAADMASMITGIGSGETIICEKITASTCGLYNGKFYMNFTLSNTPAEIKAISLRYSSSSSMSPISYNYYYIDGTAWMNGQLPSNSVSEVDGYAPLTSGGQIKVQISDATNVSSYISRTSFECGFVVYSV